MVRESLRQQDDVHVQGIQAVNVGEEQCCITQWYFWSSP
jgi:hypothetical protein